MYFVVIGRMFLGDEDNLLTKPLILYQQDMTLNRLCNHLPSTELERTDLRSRMRVKECQRFKDDKGSKD